MNEGATSAQGMLQAGDRSHWRDIHWHYKTLGQLYLNVGSLVLVTPPADVQGLQ